MKIVHILPALSKGGGERVAIELANHQARTGHEVSVVAAWAVDPALLQDSLHPGIKVSFISLTQPSRLGRYLAMLPWIWRHRGWLGEQTILHCHLTYGAIFGSVVSALRRVSGAGAPAVVETCHAVGLPIPALQRWLYARLAVGRDALVLMAEDDYWRHFLVTHPRLLSAFIPNGVSASGMAGADPSAVLAYRQQAGIPDSCRLIVGTVGMLRADRQPWLYIPLFAEIAQTLGPDVHFLMAGSGSELGRLQALVNEHGLSGRVHFPGLAINASLPLSAMNLYITLNVGAVTGMAALEAALSHIPVIAIQLLAQHQSGHKDWIWSSPDPREVAKRAIELLRSDTELKAMADSQASYARQHHSVEAMAGSYNALYAAAVERSRVKAKA
jgi:glycosyltransferase involved in cell wall biosynthesis